MGEAMSGLMERVVACRTKEEARQIVAEAIARYCEKDIQRTDQARRIVLGNIGYMAGYCDNETSDRILDLFDTEHPFFGKTHPTMKMGLAIGMQVGKLMQSEKFEEQLDEMMRAGDYAELRAWVMKGICPVCFELLDEAGKCKVCAA